MSASAHDRYRPETRLVHAGTLRSQFGETSEALFLTQGYVYDNAAQAEARFKGEDPGYQYSRFANPTVDDVRAAHGGVRRRRSRARHRDRHGRGHARDDGPGQGRRPRRRRRRRCSAPAATWSRTSCRATASPRRWSTASTSTHGAPRCGRTPRPSSWKRRPIPTLEVHRHRRGRQDRACGRRDAGRRQRVLDAAVAEPARSSAPTASSIPPPSTSTARAAASAASSSARKKFITRQRPYLHPADRPVDVAVQCLGAAQGTGDAAGARARGRPTPRRRSRRRSPSIRRCRG